MQQNYTRTEYAYLLKFTPADHIMLNNALNFRNNPKFSINDYYVDLWWNHINNVHPPIM